VAAKAETDFCAWSESQAADRAAHACTWLGACESPIGNNAFGACYFRALMAYDCAANPDHRPQQKSRDLWDCLQQVKSCAEVDACMFPDEPACGDAGVSTACSTINPADRVFCFNGATAGRENCALWGQTCSPTAHGSMCSGDPTGHSCPGEPQCDGNGTTLHWCVPDVDGGPGIDRGIECASNGAGGCGGFPSSDPKSARWLACLPGTDAGTPCTPDASATCDHGRATMCPTGVEESLDCHALLGSENACSPGALSPPFDWTSPCALPVPCAEDSCNGSNLLSCERGARFEVDCAAHGLRNCGLVPVDPSGSARAACTPPP
jgi:hypothetical protein